jgi:hypothetical protein
MVADVLDPDVEPHGDFLTIASGRVAFTDEVALVYAEELVAFEYDQVPLRRVPEKDVETSLRSRPIAVVLDRLETRMSFDRSHQWVMEPHEGLEGLRPVEAVAQGRVSDVLALASDAPT